MNSKAHEQYNIVARDIWDNFIADNRDRFKPGGRLTLAGMTKEDATNLAQRFIGDRRIVNLTPEIIEHAAKKSAAITIKREMTAASESLTGAAEKGVVKKTLSGILGFIVGEMFLAPETNLGASPCPTISCVSGPKEKEKQNEEIKSK